MSNKDLWPAKQYLLRKGPSFIPTPTDINWCSLRRNFDIFVGKIRYRVSKPEETSSVNENHTTNILHSSLLQLSNLPTETKSLNVSFRKERTNISSLETFKDLFNPSNYNKIKGNITTEERKVLKSIQNDK